MDAVKAWVCSEGPREKRPPQDRFAVVADFFDELPTPFSALLVFFALDHAANLQPQSVQADEARCVGL